VNDSKVGSHAVVGVLALQGAFASHVECLTAIGCDTREIRTVHDLVGVDGIILPGGESSTMSQLLESSGLFDALHEQITNGFPVFGTCAGMILLAREILDGRQDQRCFAAIDIAVRRNAFGRQVDSFESDIDTAVGLFHGVFIRAPRIEECGPSVEVLGRLGDEPVLVRNNNVLAASFHPEISGDTRLHQYFVTSVIQSVGA
jgi:pyridoxal 5'-phosphate synthase pdxT subunit